VPSGTQGKREKMKVKLFKTYQAVDFNKNLHTYFSTRPGFEGVKMEATQYGIRIDLNGNHAIVPYNNVAYFCLDESEQAQKPKKAVKEAE
jgi:hypothetical protein